MNRHVLLRTRDFKSRAYASFAIRATRGFKDLKEKRLRSQKFGRVSNVGRVRLVIIVEYHPRSVPCNLYPRRGSAHRGSASCEPLNV